MVVYMLGKENKEFLAKSLINLKLKSMRNFKGLGWSL